MMGGKFGIGQRIRYVGDGGIGPVGEVMDFYYNENTQEFNYQIQWTDYGVPMKHTQGFIEREMEAW